MPMTYFLPCLLERWRSSTSNLHHTGSTTEDVRNDIRRNLEWLLNSESPRLLRHLMLNSRHPRVESGEELPPEVRSSVLCFGIPVYSGRSEDGAAPQLIAEEIRQCIVNFEPRIDNSQLEVVPLDGDKARHVSNLQFAIRGLMWPKPLQEFELRTRIDLETGQALVLT